MPTLTTPQPEARELLLTSARSGSSPPRAGSIIAIRLPGRGIVTGNDQSLWIGGVILILIAFVFAGAIGAIGGLVGGLIGAAMRKAVGAT